MKFNFPKNRKTESVTISVYEKDIKKIRKLAEINKCTHNDIYKVLIEESLEEYESQFGKLEEKDANPVFSVKRDGYKAGDNKRKEIVEDHPDSFDGGGDLRTKEGKNAAAVELGRKGGLIGGNARANVLSSEEKHIIAKKAADARWNNKKEISVDKLPKDWYKKDVLLSKTEAIIHRQPLPENFTGIAYCNYIFCDKKKYNLIDGIEADGKNFCSDKCYDDFIQSAKKIDLHSY